MEAASFTEAEPAARTRVTPELVGRLVDACAQAGLPLAGPGQGLVSDQVVAERADGGVAFEPIGPVPLKGVADPVPLHRATRQGPGP